MKFKKLPPGTGSLIVFGMLFFIPGVISLINPSTFNMIGSVGDDPYYMRPGASRLFSTEETRTLGGGLCAVGLFILYLSYKHAKSTDE